MQFMDIFSPEKGAGFALNTRERDLKVRKYALIKQNGRTDAFVEYPSMYVKIKKDSLFKGSETLLYVHKGDWHASYESYKKWLSDAEFEILDIYDEMTFNKLCDTTQRAVFVARYNGKAEEE
jgi:hypothetical protein